MLLASLLWFVVVSYWNLPEMTAETMFAAGL